MKRRFRKAAEPSSFFLSFFLSLLFFTRTRSECVPVAEELYSQRRSVWAWYGMAWAPQSSISIERVTKSTPHSLSSSSSQVCTSTPPVQSPLPLLHAWPVVNPASNGPYTFTPPLT